MDWTFSSDEETENLYRFGGGGSGRLENREGGKRKTFGSGK
jgi:hypothetical protein